MSHQAQAQAAMAICERLLDNPADPEAIAAAVDLLDDNMHWDWMLRWHQLVDSLPD